MPLSSKEANALIIDKAKQLVSQLIAYRGHDRPPFLPNEYLQFVNIKEIQKTALADTSALLLKFQSGYVIEVNQNHPQVRQNFSCAHEIGHILFDGLKLEEYTNNIHYGTYDPSKTREIQAKARETLCDAVAAELLMPEFVFRKYLTGFGLSITSIEHLASSFNVSTRAATRRITEVSAEQCCAILWYPWPKNNPNSLRPVMERALNGKINYLSFFKPVGQKSNLFKAYQSDVLIKSWKSLKNGGINMRVPLEAKCYGHGENRVVISLIFPDRQKTKS